MKPVGNKSKLSQKTHNRKDSLRARNNAERACGKQRNDLLLDLQLLRVPTDALKAAQRNIRKINEKHVADMLASIAAFGQIRPVFINAKHSIIDGHVIVEAARRAGLKEVQRILIDHLSDDQLRQLRIALNKLRETCAR